jgi:hypothetical protein
MLRNALVVLILLLLTLGIADARMPNVGDHVAIIAAGGTYNAQYEGEITDIGEGLICLSVTSNSGGVVATPYDICIGVGSIVELVWR